MEQIEIYPAGGQWYWRHVNEDGSSQDSEPYADRNEAIAEGRRRVGGESVDLISKVTGEKVGEQRTRTGCRVVLLREDGSEYGELDPPPSSDEQQENAQNVTLEPASEASEVVNR